MPGTGSARIALAAGVALLALAGCDSLGTPPTPGSAPGLGTVAALAEDRLTPRENTGFDQRVAGVWADVVEADSATIPDAEDLRGTARYRGDVVLETTALGSPRRIAGDLAMTARFEDGGISGSVSGLTVEGTDFLRGGLDVNGQVVHGNRIDASLSGDVSGSDFEANLRGRMDGEFRGEEGNLAAGGVQIFGEFRRIDEIGLRTGEDFTGTMTGAFSARRD